MKNIILAIILTISITISYPSVNAFNQNENFNNHNYEIFATSDTSSFSETCALNLGVLPPITTLDTKRLYLKHYFMGLTKNFGVNTYGTCTFVALGMMLSYYDSFINDNIIPEKYDVVSKGSETDMIGRGNSPGTLFDLVAATGLTKYEYYNFLKNEYANTSFQYYLMQMAIDNDILKMKEDIDYIGVGSIQSAVAFVELYLKSANFVRDLDYELYQCDEFGSSNQQEVKQFIIDNISKGNPVYLAATNASFTSAHAMVCYDYESIDNIYAHFGWHNSNYYHANPFTLYPNQLRAFAINFNINHSHSYNYMVGDIAYCYCDDAIEAYHNHSYGIPLKLNKQYHVSYCKCGLTKKGMHWIRGATNERYAKCGACGELLDLWSDIVVGIKSMNKTPNGSYISKSGIPVIAESEVEAYLNGTLKFGGGFSDYDYI